MPVHAVQPALTKSFSNFSYLWDSAATFSVVWSHLLGPVCVCLLLEVVLVFVAPTRNAEKLPTEKHLPI